MIILVHKGVSLDFLEKLHQSSSRLVLLSLALAGTIATAAPSPVATRTILLPGPAAESSVAYHPGFDQYYASDIGNPNLPAYVFDNTGALIQTQDPINIDVRAWNYNPSTDMLEVVTYNAVGGGSGYGLIEAQIDGSGFLTGGTSTILATMPGNDGTQTMPAYDPINDRFFSREDSGNVNIVNRADGSLIGTITLDLATAGAGAITYAAIGYDPSEEWLIVTDATNDTAVIFDTAGNYVGTSALDVNVDSNYRMGYTNHQLFVFDSAQGGYQGYDIGAGIAPETVPVPANAAWAESLLVFTMLGAVLFYLRRRTYYA